MKINITILIALCAASSLLAAPLTSTTAVHSKPDANAPTLALLTAGTEPTPAVGLALPLSPGWQAVEITGEHSLYVHGKDLNKSLEVKPGAALRTSPKIDAPVFTTMEPGDTVEITGLHGKWTQIKLTKLVIGYIYTPSQTFSAASAAPTHSSTPQIAPPAAAPAHPAAFADGSTGRAAQIVNLGDGGTSALPRLFQGQFVSTRRPFMPRRPYDYQLNDSAGARYAYVDTSKLLLTEQIEKYMDHTVIVYGTARPVPDTKDIVIQVETLQLK